MLYERGEKEKKQKYERATARLSKGYLYSGHT